MPTYTVLQRNDQIRAEQESDVIKQLGLCGYVESGQLEAETPEQAVSQFQENMTEERSPKPLGLRWLMWVGSVAAVVWFTYLIFFLLPMAF